MSPYDFGSRATAAQAHRSFESLDVRVRQPSPDPWPAPWAGEVSLRDMLGASLVTYDQYLDDPRWTSEEGQPPSPRIPLQSLEPKAVYVQYQSQDPVTGEMAPVVVPASMSLDVFADASWFGQAQEEEEVIEEEKDDDEEEDRRKLRSSIKGDPILMRAKPAPPPDPYFAPVRHENMHCNVHESALRPGTVSTPRAGVHSRGMISTAPSVVGGTVVGGTLWQGMGTGAKASQHGETVSSDPQSPTRHVASAGTMSSFLKASGKDKYSRSRINEIDNLLAQQSGQDRQGLPRDNMIESLLQAQLSSSPRGASAGAGGSPTAASGSGGADAGASSPRGRRGAVPSTQPRASPRANAEDAAALAAQMAIHIQRMPQFHKGRLAQLDSTGGSLATDTGAAEAVDGAGAVVAVGEEGAASAMATDGLTTGRISPPPGADAALSTAPGGSAGVPNDASPGTPGSARTRGGTAEGRVRLPGVRAGAARLRDLDPHLVGSDVVPTQRMHNNWPDGPRRQLARNFYGMSPARILEEEEKERLQEKAFYARKTKDAELTSEAVDANASDPNSPKAKARQRNLERSLAIGAEGGVITHRLEVRIRNVDRAERVVVGRHTDRMRRNESACRQTQLLDKLLAERKKLSQKY